MEFVLFLVIIAASAYIWGKLSGKYWWTLTFLLAIPFFWGLNSVIDATRNPYECTINSFICFDSESMKIIGYLTMVIGILLLSIGLPIAKRAARKKIEQEVLVDSVHKDNQEATEFKKQQLVVQKHEDFNAATDYSKAIQLEEAKNKSRLKK